jgi:hypothetical protein
MGRARYAEIEQPGLWRQDYYRPIEAAIRWSGSAALRAAHSGTLEQRAMPEPNEFPRWPLLRLNAERIFDALAHGELPYGKAGMVRDTQRPGARRPRR